MNRMLKRYISFILFIVMCISLPPSAAYAAAENGTEYCAYNESYTEGQTADDVSESNCGIYTVINPVYADVISESDIPSLAEEEIEGAANGPVLFLSEESVYHTDLESAATELKDKLVAREATITIRLNMTDETSSSATKSQNYSSRLFYMALKHTGVATEGDSIYFQWGGHKVQHTYGELDSGGFSYTFVYSVLYYTTAEQEEEENGIVEDILAELNLSGKTDFQKIHAIYSYLCENVTYDYENDATYRLKYSAYAALVNHTAVCQGYACAFYRLCLESGVDIDARVVYSTKMNHAWNIVRLGDCYYELDSTWDANKSSFTYFLRGTEFWTTSHKYNGTSEIGYVINYIPKTATTASSTSSSAEQVYTLSETDYDGSSMPYDIQIAYPEYNPNEMPIEGPVEVSATVQNGWTIIIVPGDSGSYEGDKATIQFEATDESGYEIAHCEPESSLIFAGYETVIDEESKTFTCTAMYFNDLLGGDSPDNPGDGIPDDFQKKVTYTVVNGTWGGSGTVKTEYVTLFNSDGMWSASGTGVLTVPDTADAIPDEVYSRYGASWETTPPETVTDSESVNFNYLFRIQRPTNWNIGDVNMDDSIDIIDCSLIRHYAAGLKELSDEQKTLADVNGDGKVNVIDVNLVRRYVAELITSFTDG